MPFWAVAEPIITSVLGGLASRTRGPQQYAQLAQRGFEKIMEPTLESTSRPRPEEQPSPHQTAQDDANRIVVEPQKKEVVQPPPTQVPLAPPIQQQDMTLEQTAPPAALQPSEQPPASIEAQYISPGSPQKVGTPWQGNVYGPQSPGMEYQVPPQQQPPQQNSGKMTGVELAMLGATLASGMFQTRPGPAPPGLPGGGGINMQPVFWRR